MISFFRKLSKHSTQQPDPGFEIPDWAKEIKDCYIDIIRMNAEFIVFIDKKYEVDWITSEKFDEKLNSKENRWDSINSITSHIRLTYTEMPTYTPVSVKKSISSHLGEALVAAFHENEGLAKSVLEQVKQKTIEINLQEARKIILTVCSSCAAFIIFEILLIEANFHILANDFLIKYRQLALCFFIGALGVASRTII